MLKQVHIQHIAIIDTLDLDVESGMTVLTGETGAGKSIMIDAIQLALGQRGSVDSIRAGQDRAEISLVFDVALLPEASEWLSEHDLNSGNECIIRRVLHRDQGSKCYINGSVATQAMVRELGSFLINIHGQHEFQLLNKPDTQRQLLDEFAQHSKLVAEVAAAYENLQATKHQLDNVGSYDQVRDRIAFLQFQCEELDKVNPDVDRIHELEQTHQRLAHSERIMQLLNESSQCIDDEQHGIQTQINHLQHALNECARLDERVVGIRDVVEQISTLASEVSHDLQHYLYNDETGLETLAEVDQELSRLHDLARKHRVKLSELPEIHRAIQNELAHLSQSETDAHALEKRYQEELNHYHLIAKKLSESRKKSAKKLSQQITENIHKLNMSGGVFDVHVAFDETSHPKKSGLDKIQFMVSANPGQPVQPLQKIASGGELSRISLAVQVITVKNSSTPTLIFDEVDVGIGGKTAHIVGEMLKALSESAQVICITHLSQVAAFGKQHWTVGKKITQGKTISVVEVLSPDDRINEIARMLGGATITEEGLQHAKQLLNFR